jgi:adenylate cyclase class 2
MLEAEVKLALDEEARTRLVARLAELRAIPAGEHEQVDAYYAHPTRDFALTDEALRLRLDDGRQRVTYKGPKLDPPLKTREEIEFELATDVATASRLLARLGFRPVATVCKRRVELRLEGDGGEGAVTVCLDDVDGLGAFCEIESVAATSVESGRRTLERALERLGLAGRAPLATSYLELLLARAPQAR